MDDGDTEGFAIAFKITLCFKDAGLPTEESVMIFMSFF